MTAASPQSREPLEPAAAGISLCHLIATNFFGGPDKQILELSRRLHERGWPVLIGSFLENRERVELVDKAIEHGLSGFHIQTRSPFSLRAVTQLRRELRENHVQVLVTHGYKSNLIGRLATLGTPVLQLPTARGFTGENWKVHLYESLDRRVLRGFDQVLCVSNATRELLVGHGLRRESVRVLHNAVDCDRAIGHVDLRAEYSLPPEARVVVAAGRLSPEKGHRNLVAAMARVAEVDRSIHCLVFGSGTLEVELNEEIRGRGIEGVIRLVGFRKDVLDCLAAADLVVNPSLSEGLPNVVLEAMSVDTAVVATDVGGVAEIIPDAQTGWTVPSEDPEALANAILDAFSNRDRLEIVAAAGRERVRSEFSFERQAEEFVAICEEIVRRTTEEHR